VIFGINTHPLKKRALLLAGVGACWYDLRNDDVSVGEFERIGI